MPKSYIDRPYAWRTVLPAAKSKPEKAIVGECLMLSIKELFDRGLIEEGAFHVGLWRWAESSIFQFEGAVRYEADLRHPESSSLRLQYEVDRLEVDHCVLLSSEDQGIIGRRWWFRCPINDIRVTKLYLPAGARRFASRQAHELIYAASRRRRSDNEGGQLVALEVRKITAS